MTADQVLHLPHVTGYDNFALYLYIHRDRITMRDTSEHPTAPDQNRR
ncbi:MAG: hypothetical protein WDO24_09445 [Pseudomonadota bacterium]